MSSKIAVSGNAGPKVRSDCQIELELTDEGGIIIDLKSKVQVLYGESIKSQCLEILRFFGIKNAVLKIIDSGALPFVISARLEASVRQLIDTDLEFLPDIQKENKLHSPRNRFRFSRLYVPGNTPSMMINAGLHSADGIILDLEDSVAPEKKDEARFLVRNALRQISFNGAERMVRINQGEKGLKDLEYAVPHYVNLILIPKCEDPDQVKAIDSKIDILRNMNGIAEDVYIMPIIETAAGVEMSFEIARSSGKVVAIAVGLEDLTADMGVPRTKEGTETLYARARIVNAAKAAGIQPIDSVFSDVGDMEALRNNVLSSRAMGFEGMGCIHPRQIPVVKQGFAPRPDEIEKARKIVLAFDDAVRSGVGVVAIGTKMIDQPVVIRAQRIVDLAVRLGMLPEDWKNDAGAEND